MKFIFFLLMLFFCSNGSIFHKTLDHELISFGIESNKVQSYILDDSLDLFCEVLVDKCELIFYYPVFLLEKQGDELLYTKDVISADVLNHNKDINLELEIKESWFEKNKKSISFLYGATILLITYMTVRNN